MSVFVGISKKKPGDIKVGTSVVNKIYVGTSEVSLGYDNILHDTTDGYVTIVNVDYNLFDVWSSITVSLCEDTGAYIGGITATSPGFHFLFGGMIEVLIYDGTIQVTTPDVYIFFAEGVE